MRYILSFGLFFLANAISGYAQDIHEVSKDIFTIDSLIKERNYKAYHPFKISGGTSINMQCANNTYSGIAYKNALSNIIDKLEIFPDSLQGGYIADYLGKQNRYVILGVSYYCINGKFYDANGVEQVYTPLLLQKFYELDAIRQIALKISK